VIGSAGVHKVVNSIFTENSSL